MTDETDSHTSETLGTAAQEPDSLARRKRTRALYHFLDEVDVIIKKRCALLLERKPEKRTSGEQCLRQEMQTPLSSYQSITPRGDDELTDLDPVEVPKR